MPCGWQPIWIRRLMCLSQRLTFHCHISHYRDWFAYFDAIDVRRHLQEVEIVLIEAALEKSNGMISHAADALNYAIVLH